MNSFLPDIWDNPPDDWIQPEEDMEDEENEEGYYFWYETIKRILF